MTISELLTLIKSDWKANFFFKSKIFLVFFRLCNYLSGKNKAIFILSIPLFIFYKFIGEWILTMEVPIKTKIGKAFVIYHGYGLVINGYAVIGDGCIVRQGVTIGNKIKADGTESMVPVVGSNVEFGANSIVIGEITIGDDVKIGAGVVVTKSIPNGSVVVGQGFRVLDKS